jgi:hypothetical protein
MSSRVINPSVVPNSSITTTNWTRDSCISSKRSSTFFDSGTWRVGLTTSSSSGVASP